jgi:hypothetical protein
MNKGQKMTLEEAAKILVDRVVLDHPRSRPKRIHLAILVDDRDPPISYHWAA